MFKLLSRARHSRTCGLALLLPDPEFFPPAEKMKGHCSLRNRKVACFDVFFQGDSGCQNSTGPKADTETARRGLHSVAQSGNSDRSGGSGDSRRLSAFGCILKVEPTGLPDRGVRSVREAADSALTNQDEEGYEREPSRNHRELSVGHGESGMSSRHPNRNNEYLVSTHYPTHTPLDLLSLLLMLRTTELEDEKSN